MKNKYYYGLDGDVPFFEEQEVLDIFLFHSSY